MLAAAHMCPSDLEVIGALMGGPNLNVHMPGMSCSRISSIILSNCSKAFVCLAFSIAFFADRVSGGVWLVDGATSSVFATGHLFPLDLYGVKRYNDN